jgi:hypothetical protein
MSSTKRSLHPLTNSSMAAATVATVVAAAEVVTAVGAVDMVVAVTAAAGAEVGGVVLASG